MMGRQQRIQRKLFYTKLNLDQRIRKDHILRKFAKYIDFDFIYKEVKENYGINGNVSVPPPVILYDLKENLPVCHGTGVHHFRAIGLAVVFGL